MHILAVVVRYKTRLSESQTLSGLSEAFRLEPELLTHVRVLLWDNSPEPLSHIDLPFPVEYRHSQTNAGVSGAFNEAMQIAAKDDICWMLLLDQDTTVTAPYLARMIFYSNELAARTEIAAIMPTMRMGEYVISPREARFNSSRAYVGAPGIADGEPIGANSGMFIRVKSLLAIGGFSNEFWLDFSDMYVLHEFSLRGLKVWRASDVELEHSISIMDYDKLMSPWRYANFIEAEGAYNDLYKSGIENLAQTIRLWIRIFRQRLAHKNVEYSRITWQHLKRRLFTKRGDRLGRWRQAQHDRVSKSLATTERAS